MYGINLSLAWLPRVEFEYLTVKQRDVLDTVRCGRYRRAERVESALNSALLGGAADPPASFPAFPG
jgi:hypothetical protein